jgi:hypothetical protein
MLPFLKHKIVDSEFQPETYCCYDFELKFWRHNPSGLRYHPKNMLAGVFCEKNDSLFFKSSKDGGLQLIRYKSDIAKPKIDISFIRYNQSSATDTILTKERYDVIIEDTIKTNLKSTLYKVKILDYPYFSVYPKDNCLVLFFDSKYGIQGAYICWNRSFQMEDSRDSIVTNMGNLYEDLYKYKYWFEPFEGNYE